MLGINDSFLGIAAASDSGRKVKIQQNATIITLQYLTVRIKLFYKLLGEDIAALVQQYYTATQVLKVADELAGTRYLYLNQPVAIDGRPVYEQSINPATGEEEVDKQGNLLFVPIPEEGSNFEFLDYDVKIVPTATNDTNEKTQLMLESFLSGAVGQLLAQINPAGFFQVGSLVFRTMQTKFAPEISEVLSQTQQLMQQSGNVLPPDAGVSGQGGGSPTLQLPGEI